MASERAHKLLRNPTDAETRRWSRARRQQLEGFRFRRQQPVRPFIVDFFCPAANLIIEIDGGRHDANAARDAARTKWLEKAGHRVIRFWNNDVLTNTDGVLASILDALRL